MQRQLLKSPTDGNGTTSWNMPTKSTGANYTPPRQCLSGPDSMNSINNPTAQRNVPQNMQRNTPHKDCGCGNKKAGLPPVANRQPMPQRQNPAATQQAISQVKNYQNNTAKYPQQNQ